MATKLEKNLYGTGLLVNYDNNNNNNNKQTVNDDERNGELDVYIDKVNNKHKGDCTKFNFMNCLFYGGLDGILTVCIMVSSIYGIAGISKYDIEIILILAFSKLIGKGISFGTSSYLSERAKLDFIKLEYFREEWEFDKYQQGEINEMINIYKEKGISINDAKLILNIMAKYPNLFLEHMMIQELDLNSNFINYSNPFKNSLIKFISFIIFGILSLLLLIFVNNLLINIISICIILFISGCFLYVIYYGCKFNKNLFKSGLFVMLSGIIAASIAFIVSWRMSL